MGVICGCGAVRLRGADAGKGIRLKSTALEFRNDSGEERSVDCMLE